MVAYRRGGAFCKGIVNTARRGGLPFAPAKGSKTGQRGTKLSPLQTPLTLSCAGYEYCFSLNNREKQIRTAHRCAPKVATAYLPPPPCGTRKELRAARLLDFFDRCGCSASLHPPLAALGFAPPFPSPAAGEGLSGQAAACSAHRLSSMTFCYRFAVAPNKMRLRHLISVVASDATFA